MHVSISVGVLTVVVLGAQPPTPGPTAADRVPYSESPNHRLVFSNEFVRVVDVRLPPGYRNPRHTHARDYVAVSVPTGSSDPRSPETGRTVFAVAGDADALTNDGNRERRFLEVEILKADRSNARAVDGEPDHVLEAENEHVRVYRTTLDPGDSIPVHTHAAGWMSVTIAGWTGPGSYHWYDAGAPNPLAAGQYVLELVELEPR